jgi:predicted dehydrogenase
MSLDLKPMPPLPSNRSWKIGAIGAGFIMRDVHLVAYGKAGYTVSAITDASAEAAKTAAALRGVPKVYPSYQELIADTELDIIDIAVPPHLQLDIVRECAKHKHIKGVLAQKPLAMGYAEAAEIVKTARDAGITLAVNQNMRYDQSIRAVKTLLDGGYLGEPVLATIEMRAIPHWQTWLQDYGGRLTLYAMSIHHLDSFRYLFGTPESVYVSARKDPRTKFEHRDGICLSILEYPNGLRASSWDDVWAGPAREGGAPDIYIKWRVEGRDGMAWGTIGWPSYPNATPSTIHYTSNRIEPNVWHHPVWNEVWFPDAFQGTMGDLMHALNDKTAPMLNGQDNLETIALIDACYKSLDEHRPVRIKEITGA